MEVLGLMVAKSAPRRTVVPATWIGTVFTTVFYAASDGGLAGVDRTRVDQRNARPGGRQQMLPRVCSGLRWLTPLIAVMVMVELDRRMGRVWRVGLAHALRRGRRHAAARRPSRELHPRWGVPYVSILLFGGVASVLLVAIQLGDSMRAGVSGAAVADGVGGIPPLHLYVRAAPGSADPRLSGQDSRPPPASP